MIGPKIFNRFKNVYDEIFPLSDSGNGLKQFNAEGLTKKNISLLLTFPGVLACTLGATINQDRMADDLKKMDILKFEFNENDCHTDKDNTVLKIPENQKKINEELSEVISNICNFSISPGKKTKVSQIQLQLNRQIESFVDDEITKIRNFIQAG
ncbi:hypothetical protein, partial [Desulfobacter sp.]|uniref:hypothetical protein n=1 Tax=Desulfobacter sp. TaxID=2294 RepID=UPI003D0A618F